MFLSREQRSSYAGRALVQSLGQADCALLSPVVPHSESQDNRLRAFMIPSAQPSLWKPQQWGIPPKETAAPPPDLISLKEVERAALAVGIF